ncbi:MAG TPA: hypothetical protein VL882_21970 [Vicinamibacterales bacterium]|nr:hypothetical protein [Vicinamibacterales bacterium]
MMRLRGAGVLTIGLTLLGPTDLVQVQFSPATAEWHVRSTDHFEIYYTEAPDLNSIVREAERAYDRVSHDMRRQMSAKVPLMLVPTSHDLPRSEGEAGVIVRASGAPDRDHLFLSIEPRNGREKMLANGLAHVLKFEGRRIE